MRNLISRPHAQIEPAASIDDAEKGPVDHLQLENNVVENYSWDDITVEVKDRKTKQPLKLLNSISGQVAAGMRYLFEAATHVADSAIVGELLAIMGPSGCGKTTLLNVLANRIATANAKVHKKLYINGTEPKLDDFRKISVYVEQEEALLGALTVHETVDFAARLSLPRYA